MAFIQLLKQTKVHQNTSFFGFAQGDDVFNITVPAGKLLRSVTLNIISTSGAAAASLVQRPPENATGNGTIKIHWWAGPFSKITFELTVRAEDAADGVTQLAECRANRQ